MKKLIEDQQCQGLASDLVCAFRHRQVVKELKIVHSKLKPKIPTYLNELFLYLLDSAKTGTVLHISKMYDRSTKGRKTRSIVKLINQIRSTKIDNVSDKPFLKSEWQKFISRHSSLMIKHPDLDVEPNKFLDAIKLKIEALEMEGMPLDKIRIWRDKFIAHNERYDIPLKMEDEEVEVLIELAYSVLDYINTFVDTGSFVITDNSNPTFVNEIFKDHFAK